MPTQMLLETAFEQMKHSIIQQNIVPDKFHPRNTDYEPGKNNSDCNTVEVIVFKEVKNLKNLVHDDYRSSEAYSINLAGNGETIIQITSPLGGINALQTFSQLFFAHSNPSFGHYCSLAPLSIHDWPNFKHRGLNLDISRNWIPPTAVMRTIEAMAATKLNQLHLHAADAQSWPLEIPSLPALAEKSAYSESQIWSVADLEAVQHHGLLHGVEVFLEIDLPGHTTAIGDAFPELITAANEDQWSYFTLQPPSGQLKLNSSEVTQFLSTLLNDLLPRQSRWTSKFHIGGDELNLNAYTLDPTVRSSSPRVLQPLVQAFVDHVISVVQSHGLEPIVWEELALEWNLTLPSSVTVQTWLSTSALNAVLAKGHKVLFGSSAIGTSTVDLATMWIQAPKTQISQMQIAKSSHPTWFPAVRTKIGDISIHITLCKAYQKNICISSKVEKSICGESLQIVFHWILGCGLELQQQQKSCGARRTRCRMRTLLDVWLTFERDLSLEV